MQDKDKSAQTILKMECGRIDLSNPVQKAFILLGKTKAGKTTSIHYMMHHPLIGAQLEKYSPIIYRLQQAKQIYKQAKIGQHQSRSQTQIPNYFRTQINNEACCAIDLPGFADSYGCFRSVSNRYFIHKVFSQVQKIKFIVVVAYIDIIKTADGMIKTFTYFFQSFQNIKKEIQKILPSISLLVTGVPKQIDDQGIITLYKRIQQNFPSNYVDIYKKLKESLITNKQVFLFRQADLGKTCDVENKLLQRINSRCKQWWERKKIKSVVDTSQIKITLSDYKGKDQKNFMEQLNMLSSFMEQKIKQIKKQQTGLLGVIHQLLQGCEKENQYVLSEKVINFLNQNEKKVKKQSEEYQLYYRKYEQKRKRAQIQLFKQDLSQNDNPTYLKEIGNRFEKIKAIKKISEIVQKVVFIQHQRNIEAVSLFFQQAQQLLKLFLHLLRNRPTQLQKMRKYVFIVFSNLQIMKQIYFLFNNTAKQLGYHNQKEALLPKQFQSIYLSFPTSFKEIFNKVFRNKQNPYLLIINFIQSLNTSNAYNNMKTYDTLINFILSCKEYIMKISHQAFKIEANKQEQVLKMFDKKILQLQSKKLQTKVFNENQLQLNQLFQYNNKLKQNIQECQLSPKLTDRYDDHLCQNLKINQLIAFHLKKKNINTALKIYQSLNDAHEVLEYYSQQYKNMKYDSRNQQSKQKMLHFLIDYMKKAYKYSRLELAIQKAQQAYSIAQMLGDKRKLQKIGKFLFKICPVSYDDSSGQDNKGCQSQRRQYIQMMNNGLFKVDLNETVTKQLQDLCKKDKKPQPGQGLDKKNNNESPKNQKKQTQEFFKFKMQKS